ERDSSRGEHRGDEPEAALEPGDEELREVPRRFYRHWACLLDGILGGSVRHNRAQGRRCEPDDIARLTPVGADCRATVAESKVRNGRIRATNRSGAIHAGGGRNTSCATLGDARQAPEKPSSTM